jgi:hypothetical protein
MCKCIYIYIYICTSLYIHTYALEYIFRLYDYYDFIILLYILILFYSGGLAVGRRVSFDTYSASPIGNILSNLNIENFKTENENEKNHFMGITNGVEKVRFSSLGDIYTQGTMNIYNNSLSVLKSGNIMIQNNIDILKNIDVGGMANIRGGLEVGYSDSGTDTNILYGLKKDGMLVKADIKEGVVVDVSVHSKHKNEKFEGTMLLLSTDSEKASLIKTNVKG